MFQPVTDSNFVSAEHAVLKFWHLRQIFQQLRRKNTGRKRWSFIDGPITANNPMGVHHAWGRTYKDTYQRFFAMTGHDQRYQNGFDCQGLWVEVEVEKQLGLGTKTAVHEFGIDNFVNECKRRVLRFAARQTEQSIRLGYWMDWDNPDQLRQLAESLGTDTEVTFTAPSGKTETAKAHQLVEQLGNPEWGGSYFTFSTENNETIWTFLKKCFERGKIYQGHDVMPWSGRGGSAYSQMEIAEGRKLTTHKSVFVRLPIRTESGKRKAESGEAQTESNGAAARLSALGSPLLAAPEYLLVWTTTPWTLTSNVACAVNPDLDYVKIQAKRDNAIYYFAKDNLNFQRLATEFRDGFGRPEWKWPEGVGKLKSLAQIFKEQGGFEELGTIKGAEMIGWVYEGPFDDLKGQQQPGGVPIDESNLARTGVNSHRVIDGGRDSRGSANVVAGEGTGIVHIAPGCGDIDHKMGVALGLPIIAPLKDDGTYSAEFGDFAGLEAISPKTAELVFEKLKAKGMLFAVETYPHIYPHCWRTGDELVFRLVDEWFINMDWRDEIKDVTKQIRWLPDSIDGQEREIEWLSNMSDWMISKKRFWGLALPIWVNENDPSDFDVMGSLDELKERAVEGWGEFEGHTPHRPWIDNVLIESQTPGNEGQRMRRIPDVGNPWLDAGIVPFSTLNFNERYSTDVLRWADWYPADLVTECFPGQFRNWFYSMLSLSTMMQYDETGQRTAAEKKPFRTLLGHRLVTNEQGKPMHKSDGTAIWFEEAAEQLGVDTMRWMYLAQNPSADLRFGTRHPAEPVTLQTPDGPISQTLEGVTTAKVTSGPADETRRQILIPLWNCYKFFIDYAIADGFVPSDTLRHHAASTVPSPPAGGEGGRRPDEGGSASATSHGMAIEKSQPPHSGPLPGNGGEGTVAGSAADRSFIPVAERPEIDRWILSNLQSLIQTAHREMPEFNAAGFCSTAAGFIDDLSNWYIRRNRRRFWRSRDARDIDKQAAYETLYEVLVTLCRLLAPCIPFLTERMYQNLVLGRDLSQAPHKSGIQKSEIQKESIDPHEQSVISRAAGSVHLCDYPTADKSLLDEPLNLGMAAAQKVVRLAHKLREEANLRVRQPLAELQFAVVDDMTAEAIERLADVIGDELNIHQVTRRKNLDGLVSYAYKPNLKTLGPKYGKLLNALRTKLPELGDAILSPLRNGLNLTVELDGSSLELTPDDVLISTEQAAAWACADDAGIQIAISTVLTPELIREGMSRDFVRQVQQLRKEADLDIQDRIQVQYHSEENSVHAMIAEWGNYIRAETLADKIESHMSPGVERQTVQIGNSSVTIWLVTRL